MSTTSRTLPDNTSIIIPRLFCRDAAAEVAFRVRAFEAVSLNERPGPNGTLAHALLKIGPEMIMIQAEWPGLPSRAPAMDASSPVVIFLYVPNVDETVERAQEAGATVVVPWRISSGATGPLGSWTPPATCGQARRWSKLL